MAKYQTFEHCGDGGEWYVQDTQTGKVVLSHESVVVCDNVAWAANHGAMGTTECDEVAESILQQAKGGA